MFYSPESLIMMFLGIAITMWAQFKVKSTFRKYDGFVARSGATADQVVRDILQQGGLNVAVEHVPGNLTDHYDPRDQTLRLSDSVYGNRSLAAIGVAAHEAGHAFQHAQGYVPLSLRTSLVPVANIGSKLSWILIIAGFIFSSFNLLFLGIIFFSAAVVFSLVTLPVEFNASSRALRILAEGGYLTSDEVPASRKVLNAAALTYVASALVAVLELLRLLWMSGLLGGSDD
ncbi:MAG: zinc metallopeptidase [Candidatus Latescibacteria bacterium]|nr:zinc metallopeptidase [Candidatus Latescibacterota bacterium]